MVLFAFSTAHPSQAIVETGAIQSIIIKTNVDLCDAEIIVDDTDNSIKYGAKRTNSHVIYVKSDITLILANAKRVRT